MPDTSRISVGDTRHLTLPEPLPLDCGEQLSGVRIAYETWGKLNADKSNAILVCHALTGDQFAAGENTVTGRPAWWPRMIGPGKPIDTDRYHVIATNVLGGCMGTTGPASDAPDGKPWGTRFPVITIAGLQLGSIITGALITETVFQWPGIGSLFLSSVAVVDVPVMAAYLIFVGFVFVVVNLIVDILYYVVDPRLRVGAAKGH